MKTEVTDYNGYQIEKRTDIKTHCCMVLKCGDMVKAIAGDILADGSENSIEKAKQWIDDQV